jgi:ABC-2 type transport system permease protein
MLSKILQIARREYFETVKTKAFIIGVLALPVLMTVMMIFGGKMQQNAFTGPRDDRHVAVLNNEESIDQTLREMFEDYNNENQGRKLVPHYVQMNEEEGKQAVRDEDFSALLIVDENTISGDGHARMFSLPSSDVTLQPTMRRIINKTVSTVRYQQNGLSPELVRELSRGVWLEDIQLSDKGEGKVDRMAGMFLPFIFLMLIFFGIMISSQGLLNSIIEEKNNRVIEVLLAAVSPLEMMAGKILGQSAIGLTLVGLYAAGGAAAASFSGYGAVLSTIGPDKIAVLILNVLLGFLLFNSMFAAVGSSVNSVKEAQSFITPIMLVIMVPMMFWTAIVQQPHGTLAMVTSLLPPVSPLVMIMRIASLPAVPWLQVILSLLILAGAVFAVVWAASHVFRVGILMYGKAPSVRELIRWVRES